MHRPRPAMDAARKEQRAKSRLLSGLASDKERMMIVRK
jgi:hypothetical protein